MDYFLFLISFMFLLNFSAFAGSWLSEYNHYRKKLYTFVSFYLTTSVSILFCGFGSILNPIWVTIFCIAINVPIFLKTKNFHHLSNLSIPIDFVKFQGFGIFVVSFYIIVASLGNVWISLDDSTYHAAMPWLWIKNNSFFVKGYTYQQFFPLNGSLFSTFFLLFFKSEYSACLSEVLIVLIGFLSIRSLVDERRANSIVYIAFFIFFMSMDVQKYLVGFSDSDILPSVLFLVCLVLFEKSGSRLREEFFGVLILGFLVGVKLTNLFFCLPFLIFIICNDLKTKRIPLYIFSFLIFSSPWYLKNLYYEGNPIYPFSKFGLIGIFNESLTIISSIKGIWSSLNFENKLSVGFGFLGWQQLSWLPSLLLLFFLIINLIKNNNYLKIISFLIAFIMFTYFYFSSPFSGLNESLGLNINSSRYYLPLILSFLIFVSKDFDFNFKKNHKIFVFILLFIYVFLPRYTEKKLYFTIFVAAFFYMLVYRKILKKINLNFGILSTIIITVVFFFSGPNTKNSKNKSIWYIKYLEDEKKPLRATIFDDFIFRSFYLFGDNFNLIPVRLDFFGNDKIDLNNDEILVNYIYSDFKPSIFHKFCDQFLDNLVKSNINLLILSKSPKGNMPTQNCPDLDEIYLEKIIDQNGFIYKNLRSHNL